MVRAVGSPSPSELLPLSQWKESGCCYSIFARVWQIVKKCFSFLLCGLCKNNRPSVRYFKVVDEPNKGFLYRLVIDGMGTENELVFTSNHLNEISFFDEKYQCEIQKMLLHVIKKEKMDYVTTSCLRIAKRLFDLGFEADANVTIILHSKAQQNDDLTDVLQEAVERTAFLYEKERRALEKVKNAVGEDVEAGCSKIKVPLMAYFTVLDGLNKKIPRGGLYPPAKFVTKSN